MEWFVVGIAVGIASLAAVGLSRRWRLASWGIALGAVAWVLAGAAALISTPEAAHNWQRAMQHRHALWVIALALEAAVACGALALAGWREARSRAAVAAWLACGFAGLMLAIR